MSTDAKQKLEKLGYQVSVKYEGGPNNVWEATAVKGDQQTKAQGRSEEEAIDYLQRFIAQRKE